MKTKRVRLRDTRRQELLSSTFEAPTSYCLHTSRVILSSVTFIEYWQQNVCNMSLISLIS